MSACYFTHIQGSHPRNITRHMNDTPSNPIQPLPVPLWRHAFAMLYDTLLVVPLFMAEWLAGPVHALALHTYTPDEWQRVGEAPESPDCRGGTGK